jgi:hypothetical protein
MDTNAIIINFDAYQYGTTISLYSNALKNFLDRGGMIAWGIVPTAGSGGDITNETPENLVSKLKKIIKTVVDRGINEKTLLEMSWITPTCTTNTLTAELSDKVYEFTKEVSDQMREKYFG